MSSPAPPLPEFPNDDPDNTIRIMLATDNHIGYLERDHERSRDALNAFKEILQLAVKHQVDFILLAGDLFHDNRPSRDVVYSTIALLREYTLGDKPVQIELLSDPEDGKAPGYSFPAINYEDPNLNIAIPVFSIHGNHDDPQGSGPEGALCALDLVSVTGLLNYMGKIDLPTTAQTSEEPDGQNDGITIRPVLLRKGHTKLGMYGVGNIKDQRMHFELRSGRVKMYMPTDKDEWFNIMLLHQNRVAHSATTYVPEGMFSDSINLVVWGHEHDCRIIPEPVTGKPYFITQPGSSVATSLTEGEALQKHCALVQINTKSFTLTPIPLLTVRPMIVSAISLSEAAEEEGLDLENVVALKRYLTKKVEELIEKAMADWETRRKEAIIVDRAIAPSEEYVKKMLPLVRLKVDTTGAPELFNPIRFGVEFANRVANPRDVLVFHRSPRRMPQKPKTDRTEAAIQESLDDPGLSTSEKLERVRVQNLVREYLAAQELQLLNEAGLSDAIGAFVEKDDGHSISLFVESSLKSLIKNARVKGALAKNVVKIKTPTIDEGNEGGEEEVISNGESEDLDEMIRNVKEAAEKEYEENRNKSSSKSKGKGKDNREDNVDSRSIADSMDIDIDGDFDFREEAGEGDSAKRKASTKSKGVGASNQRGKTIAPAATARKVNTSAKAVTKSKGKKRAGQSDSSESAENVAPSEIETDEDSPEPIPPKKSRAAVLETIGTTRKGKTVAKRAQPTLNFVPSGATRTTGRKAAVAARGKAKSAMESDSDE